MMKSTMVVLLITALFGMISLASATSNVTSWHTTDGSDNAFPVSHSVIVNATANFIITYNSTSFPNGWSAKIWGYDGTNWTQLTFAPPSRNGTNNPAVLTLHLENFDGILLSNSTNNTMMVEFCNNTGANCENLSVGVWSSMQTANVNTTTMTVAVPASVGFNITDQTGSLQTGYVSFAPANEMNRTSTMATGSPQTLIPVYAGNVTFYISNASGSQAAIINSGITVTNSSVISVAISNAAISVSFGSSPATIYKNFLTNVTVNLSNLNSTIAGFGTASAINTSSINYSITVSAGNYTNTTIGTGNMSAGSFSFSASNLTFNRAQVGTGNVNVSVRVKLDVNKDGIWDYDATTANSGTVVDAPTLILASMTPSNKILSVNTNTSQDNNIAYSFINASDQPADFNLTIINLATSPIFYCNNTGGSGCTTLLVVPAVSSATVRSSGGAVDLNVYPEQYGSFGVSISSNDASYTLATDTINVTGAIVSRTAILPTLGSTLIYGQTYAFSVPVKRVPNTNDFAANISVRDTKSNGGNFSVNAGIGNLSSNTSNGALFVFSVTPANLYIGDNLSIDVFGLTGDAYFRNVYTIDYPRDYAIDALPCALKAGFRNIFNVSVNGGNVTTGNLTITYLDNNSAIIGSPDATPLSGNSTAITSDVPSNAVHAQFVIVDNANHEQSNITVIGVSRATMTYVGIELSNGTQLAGSFAPSNFVMIPDIAANLTFNVSAGCIQAPKVYLNGLGNIFAVNTTTNQAIIALSTTQLNNYMSGLGSNYTNISGSVLRAYLNDSHNDTTNLVNVTVAQPTITAVPSTVRVNESTSVLVTVSAYGTGIPNLNITINNSRLNGTTNANGSATISINATLEESMPIYINLVQTTASIEATTGCALLGDNAPCYQEGQNNIALSEVVALINQWVGEQVSLHDVVVLINAWASQVPV